MTERLTARADRRVLTPWRAVIGFGVVSLTADMVYEGARSVTGPLLAALGASALLVGLITGIGEAMSLVLRLVFGSWADRSGRYWTLTFLGYGITAICVPALAITPFLASLGLAVACCLILAERAGKAVRSPAKTALLAQAAVSVGLGRGFAVHKALDQLGAFAGPLLVAAVAAVAGTLWPALAVLIIPGVTALLVLLWLWRKTAYRASTGGDASNTPKSNDPVRLPVKQHHQLGGGLPVSFWMFACAAGAATAGLVTFGVISYHLTQDGLMPVPAVPLIYAAAMATEALAALATGALFDHIGGRVLFGLPILVAAVPPLAFANSSALAIVGVLIWGAAMGVQDSTVKALVADLVPSSRHATAYGAFAAVQGSAAMAGSALAGALYQQSLPVLVAIVAVSQVLAFVLLKVTLDRSEN